VDCTPSLNTAVAQTNAIDQSGACQYAKSTNGTTGYVASLAAGCAGLAAYTEGMRLILNADTTCSTSCTLNVDTIGIRSIKKIDGVSDPSGSLIANQPQEIVYNGTVWLLMR